MIIMTTTLRKSDMRYSGILRSTWWQFLNDVRNYPHVLCNIPEERRSQLLRGGNLKSRNKQGVLNKPYIR